MDRPSVSRRQLSFALSVVLAPPLSAVASFPTRTLLSLTDAGSYLESGGAIETWKLQTYDAVVVGVTVLVFILSCVAAHILAGALHAAIYRTAAS